MTARTDNLTLALDRGDVRPATKRCGQVYYSPFRPREMVGSIGDPYWQAILAEPMTFVCGSLSITLPEGFWWDGASIKYRWVNSIIPRWGWPVSMGSGPHDFLFSSGRHLIPDQDDPRRWADNVLRDFWGAAGVNRFRRNAGHGAVRRFGRGVWDKGTEIGFGKPEVTKEMLVSNGLEGHWLTDKQRKRAA